MGVAGPCMNTADSKIPVTATEGMEVKLPACTCPDGDSCRWDFYNEAEGRFDIFCEGTECMEHGFRIDEARNLSFNASKETAGVYCWQQNNVAKTCFEVTVKNLGVTGPPLEYRHRQNGHIGTGMSDGSTGMSSAGAYKISIGLLATCMLFVYLIC